ncbi:MAG: DUF433 domain-containing protein [Candidatus Promineofilum sp.]|nr:DUF433 domain-containing protein [Promineifilum sp.]MCW5861546.1 DUF433 domain-containing protein [Anaerolineae bacterium]
MARYPLNLPQQLKQEAEALAQKQGISLNQFILWATAEKVGALNQQLDDPAFPHVTYRRGAAGIPTPILRGTGIRVQAIAIAHEQWGLSPAEIAAEYELSTAQIEAALAFLAAHRAEIETLIAREERLSREAHG